MQQINATEKTATYNPLNFIDAFDEHLREMRHMVTAGGHIITSIDDRIDSAVHSDEEVQALMAIFSIIGGHVEALIKAQAERDGTPH